MKAAQLSRLESSGNSCCEGAAVTADRPKCRLAWMAMAKADPTLVSVRILRHRALRKLRKSHCGFDSASQQSRLRNSAYVIVHEWLLVSPQEPDEETNLQIPSEKAGKLRSTLVPACALALAAGAGRHVLSNVGFASDVSRTARAAAGLVRIQLADGVRRCPSPEARLISLGRKPTRPVKMTTRKKRPNARTLPCRQKPEHKYEYENAAWLHISRAVHSLGHPVAFG